MNVIKFICCLVTMGFIIQTSAIAQANSGEQFKKYINNVAQKAELAENADEKRIILNESFDKLLKAVNRIEKMKHLSEEELSGIAKLKNNIKEKKNELNGLDGYKRVKDGQLDNFTDYVQQDLEQANTYVTLSLGLAIIIAILLLML